MFLIPYRWFWITSTLTEDEVKRRISAHVDLTSPYGLFAIYDHKYGGTVTPKGFSLKRCWRNRSTINIQVEWDEIGSRMGVRIEAPDSIGLLVCLPLFVAVVTVQMGYLAGAAAMAGGALTCLAYCLDQGGLIKDLERMLSGAPSL